MGQKRYLIASIQMDKKDKKPFMPKGKNILEQEAAAYVDKHLSHIEDDDKSELINKMVSDGLKSEQFKASIHKQKTNAQNAHKYYKNLAAELGYDPKTGAKKPQKRTNSAEEQEVSPKDYSKHYARGGTDTEMRKIKKLMRAGLSFNEASNDPMYLLWKEKNDEKIENKGFYLPPHRGGRFGGQKSELSKEELELSGNLPPGFSDKTPKSN